MKKLLGVLATVFSLSAQAEVSVCKLISDRKDGSFEMYCDGRMGNPDWPTGLNLEQQDVMDERETWLLMEYLGKGYQLKVNRTTKNGSVSILVKK